MNKIQFSDPGNWRRVDRLRPWYAFAKKLVNIKNGEMVLDLGSGNGEFADILKLLGKKVYCTDGSEIYIENLKRKGFRSKVADFNHKLPYKNNFFDGVSCQEVIEHITKAEQLLKEINRILKKNGWLIISTPNISWIGYRLMSLIGKIPFKEGYHLRYFNYYSLKQKLIQSDFKIVKMANFSPLPYINRLKQIWIPIKFWPSLFAQNLVYLCQKNK